MASEAFSSVAAPVRRRRRELLFKLTTRRRDRLHAVDACEGGSAPRLRSSRPASPRRLPMTLLCGLTRFAMASEGGFEFARSDSRCVFARGERRLRACAPSARCAGCAGRDCARYRATNPAGGVRALCLDSIWRSALLVRAVALGSATVFVFASSRFFSVRVRRARGAGLACASSTSSDPASVACRVVRA